KQAGHLADLQKAVAVRGQFRMLELMALGDYPPAHRWGTFYGQSASLVRFLAAQAGPERFLDFVSVALEQGYEPALKQGYAMGLPELERQWHASLKTSGQWTAIVKPHGEQLEARVRVTTEAKSVSFSHAAPVGR